LSEGGNTEDTRSRMQQADADHPKGMKMLGWASAIIMSVTEI
jgi:hypothetical protein